MGNYNCTPQAQCPTPQKNYMVDSQALRFLSEMRIWALNPNLTTWADAGARLIPKISHGPTVNRQIAIREMGGFVGGRGGVGGGGWGVGGGEINDFAGNLRRPSDPKREKGEEEEAIAELGSLIHGHRTDINSAVNSKIPRP